jgi:hypothetical protein
LEGQRTAGLRNRNGEAPAGAAIGEEFLLRINDNNTTIQNGVNIVTRSGSNITAQGVYRFVDVGGGWHEV